MMREAGNGRAEAGLDAVVRQLRTLPPDDLSARDRIMEAVRAEAAAGAVAAAGLPRPFGARALAVAGLLAAAAVAVLWLGAGRNDARAPAGDATPRFAASRSLVPFELDAPDADRVSLVGTFNDWDPAATLLHRPDRDSPWSVTVPLPPGAHEYQFIVDGGRWVPDAGAPLAGAGEFGTPNSVVVVRGEGGA